MNSSLLDAIQDVLAARSPEALDAALPQARAAAAAAKADAGDVLSAVAQAVRENLGLADRRAFDERLDLELRRSARSRKSFALVLIGLEESSGESGDRLREIARAIAAQVRLIDFAARIAPAQIGILLIEVEMEAAQAIAGRIRSALVEAHVPAATGLTLSYPIDTAETLIERAEAALYEARFGR